MSYTGRISSRTVTIAAAAMQDDDGIKTSFATVAAPVTVVPLDFNGAVVSSSTGLITGLARVVTITRSNNASQFSVSPIVMTYVRAGQTLTESITPGSINGNDVLAFTAAVERIVSIAFPTQGGTGGTFKIGVRDICSNQGDTFVGVECAAAGTLYVQYGEGAGSATDAIPIATAQAGTIKPIAPSRILTDTTKTTVGVTVYLP